MSVTLGSSVLRATSISSAATTDVGATTTVWVYVGGTATITSFGTAVNKWRKIRFTGIMTLVHNGTSLYLPEAENIVTANGDTCEALSDASGNWIVHSYFRSNMNQLVFGNGDVIISRTAPDLLSFGGAADSYRFDGTILGSSNVWVAQGISAVAGGAAVGLLLSSDISFGVFFGSGPPTISKSKGSLYLRTDGSAFNDKIYVNENGSTGWTAVITGLATALTHAPVSFTTSGENALVAAVGGQVVRVYALVFTVSADVTLTFKSAAGGSVIGTLDLYAGASVTLTYDGGEPHFTSTSGGTVVVSSSATCNLKGWVKYTQS